MLEVSTVRLALGAGIAAVALAAGVVPGAQAGVKRALTNRRPGLAVGRLGPLSVPGTTA